MLDLDPNAPWFGARGGGRFLELLSQADKHPKFMKCFFFVLYDERFGPEGKAFGKVCGLGVDQSVIGHHGGMEARMLLFLEKQRKTDPGLKELPLPTVYWASEHVPITSAALGELPMIAWGNRVYPHCGVTICKWYNGNFCAGAVSTFATDEAQLRVFLFEILHGLSELQRRYKFQHNDLHKDNILLQESDDDGKLFPEKSIDVKRKIGRMKDVVHFRLPERLTRPVLWDFGASVLHAAGNKASIPNDCGAHELVGPTWCTPQTYVPSFDIHGLFMSILAYLPDDSEAREFILSLYPEELIFHAPMDMIEKELGEEETLDGSDDDSHCSDEQDGGQEEEPATNDAPELSQKYRDEDRFRDMLLYLNAHELIADLPDLKRVIRDTLGLQPNEYLPTSNEHTTNQVIDKFGDISISSEYPKLCYGHNASFLDYWYYLYPAEERAKYVKNTKENRFAFAPPDERGCLASYKLCKDAWEGYHLPTPHDLLLYDYFRPLRVTPDTDHDDDDDRDDDETA